VISAREINELQARRRLAEALARARLESLGNEALLEKPQFDPFRPLAREQPQFAPPPLPAEEQKPKRHFNPRVVQFRDDDPVIDSVKALGSGALKGFVGLGGLPGDLERLGRLGINLAGKKIFGRADSLVDENTFAPTNEDVIRSAGKYISFYNPKTIAGRYAESFGENAIAFVGPGGPIRGLVRVAVPAVAGQTAYELAPERYQDLAKALTGVVTGHYAAKPYTARGRADALFAPRATQHAQDQLKTFGPDSFLFEATNRFSPFAKYAGQQNTGSSKALLQAIAERANSGPVRPPQNTRPTNMNNRTREIEQRFGETYDRFPPSGRARLPHDVKPLSNHPLFEVLPKALEQRVNNLLPATIEQRMKSEIAERLGLRGSKAVEELRRLKTDQWWRELQGRLDWISKAQSSQDIVNGTYRAIDPMTRSE
jgi:hypothetical protein